MSRRSGKGRAARFEMDITDPKGASPQRWLQQNLDVLMRLRELHAGDAGEMSGAGVRFLGTGDSSILVAEFGTHCLGVLDGAYLLRFLELAVSVMEGRPDAPGVVGAELFELYPNIEPRRPSGAQLVYDGHSLGAWTGPHCCGVQSGKTLNDFLSHAWLRATSDPQPCGKGSRAPVVSIEAGWKRRCAEPELKTAG